MPRTRSQANSGDNTNNPPPDPPQEEDYANGIETHLSNACRGVKELRDQVQMLRNQNEKLTKELQIHKDVAAIYTSPRRNRSNPQDIVQIHGLEEKIRELEAVHKKDLRRIDKLRTKEVKAEARELENDVEAVAFGDSAHRMRKLLRRFNDLMLIVTLGEGETCPVCLENLELTKCSNFPCEHVACNDCLSRISRGADETVQCPICRQRYNRDEIGLVYMNETSRWDALLDVAQAFSAFDRGGGEETEEEEDEEDFIDDGSGLENASERQSQQDVGTEEQASLRALTEEVSECATPASCERRSFSESPTKDKRKRLERLVEERSNKKRRS
ncbi:hypothetical protein AX17_000981 [Amanita inopinata Kibby_2008]|nr:hypothetical protein AX17_000981 [Amanita inopinata Kibby_2008]